MGSKSVALVLSLNLLLLSMVSANEPVPVPAVSNKKQCPLLSICLLPPLLGGKRCCPLIQGLIDLDAAVCLCAAVDSGIGRAIGLNLDILVNLILNTCGRKLKNYKCS
ncbi:hydrophobic seed protein [Cajanus cajan]|uniref:14 kDa proline-rich protein DC2.15 n=1 Tax=Cajanus cajan TaxID=3821 RepID=A0A151R1H2_CAJCA|nr:hydrophobic seed protein [Cajanus cajan]KYP36305.1 14 kDa proline-rich protein DC2.15 [Cajanus cajan]